MITLVEVNWMIGQDFSTASALLSLVMACDTITSRRWALPSHAASPLPPGLMQQPAGQQATIPGDSSTFL